MPRFHSYHGVGFRVECPTRSGNGGTLDEEMAETKAGEHRPEQSMAED